MRSFAYAPANRRAPAARPRPLGAGIRRAFRSGHRRCERRVRAGQTRDSPDPDPIPPQRRDEPPTRPPPRAPRRHGARDRRRRGLRVQPAAHAGLRQRAAAPGLQRGAAGGARRALQTPLVSRETLQRLRVPLHPHQPQNGPHYQQGREPDRTEPAPAVPAAAQRAHAVGGPLRGVLSHRRGRLHLCAVRGQQAPQLLRDAHLQEPDDAGPHQPVQKLHHDCLQLNAPLVLTLPRHRLLYTSPEDLFLR